MARTESRAAARRGKVSDVGGRETKSGLVQVGLTLDPVDLEILRREAQRRAKVREGARADWNVSELVRLAIRAWISKNVPPKP